MTRFKIFTRKADLTHEQMQFRRHYELQRATTPSSSNLLR
jgi:hypothetical protein